MKKLLLILLVSPMLLFCQKKETKMQNTDTEKKEILALTRKFTELMISRNTAELNKIVAEDFTLTHITGYVQPKEEWFEEINAESMKYYSAEEVEYSVEVKENKATFVQKNRLDARIWGSRNVWRLQQTMSLEKRNGKWFILKSVAKTW